MYFERVALDLVIADLVRTDRVWRDPVNPEGNLIRSK
jgi:hypothetical protein